MTTRRRLLVFGLPVALLLLGVGVWLLGSAPAVTSSITMENAARIKGGMTLEEVEAILRDPGKALNAGDNPNSCWISWQGPDGFFVTVQFEGTPGRVNGIMQGTLHRETLLERIRRWVGL
jgi:hypothetical protein